MTGPARRGVNPDFYFSVVEHATRNRLPTAEVWNLIREQAENAGLSSPGITVADVNRLRAQANSIRTADTQLARAEVGEGLTGAMISVAPWARGLDERNAMRAFAVRFRHTTIVDGVEQTDYRTDMFRGTLPPTVDDLLAELERDAQRLAHKYLAEHAGIDSVSILEV